MTDPTYQNPIWHGNWRIYRTRIDHGGAQWCYAHDDFDGGDGSADDRYGYEATIEDCRAQIDQWEETRGALARLSHLADLGKRAKAFGVRFPKGGGVSLADLAAVTEALEIAWTDATRYREALTFVRDIQVFGGEPAIAEAITILRSIAEKALSIGVTLPLMPYQAIREIGRRARGNAPRTMDELMRDMAWIDDECRRLLADGAA